MVLVVPYPSYIHFIQPAGVTLADVGGTNKSILVVMVGSMKNSKLRETLAAQLTASPRGHFIPLSPDECWNRREQSASAILNYARKATFCLQPPGDTPTRKSFYDTLLSGCIPVTFVEGLVQPFHDLLDYSAFTVNVREKDFLDRKLNIVDMLGAIAPRTVSAMQSNVAKVMQYLQYGAYHHGDDAVTTVLRSLVYQHKITPFLPPELMT